mmetsp:Transcript_80938/g.212468  ORF Transcript_80938/g.212468 Transcript_80938/m.212468 type:complete len:580 (+) Transcript_80938:125-1864(+)
MASGGGWPCLNSKAVDDMRSSETELIDGSQGARKIEIVMEDLPPCKDPELQKWLFRVIKESNAEMQMHIEARMEQLLLPLLQNSKKKLPKAAHNGGGPSEVHKAGAHDAHGHGHGHPHGHAAPPPALDATAVEVAPSGEATPVPPAEPKKRDSDKDLSAGSKLPDWMWQQRGIGYTGATDNMANPPTRIDRFMHMPLDVIAGIMIALNTFVSFLQLDWQGYLINVQLKTADEGGWPNAKVSFEVLENFFCAIFLGELFLRLWYYRCTFFLDRLNVLDGTVVVVTTADNFVISNIMSGQSNGNLGFIRIIRYCKLVRTLRFVRAMQLCSPLRVLIRTILSSFASLFWSMVILCAFMLMASLFLCQTLQDFIKDEEQDKQTRLWVNQHYGTASKALWTMFEITFSGGWPGKGRNVIEGVSPWYAIFFFCYVGGVVFAVIHVVSALLIKDTLAVAAADQDMMMAQKAKEKDKFARRLREVFSSADESDDGMVNWDEFHAMLGNPKAQASLSAMGLDAHQCESLFSMLDDGDGTVSFDEFLKGVVRLKGQARSMDVLAIASDQRKLLKHIVDVEQKLDAVKGD